MLATIRRAAVLATVAATAALATPGAARPLPHLALTKSSPMKDSTVTSPKAIQLWFTEAPTLAVSKIAVIGPTGTAVKLGRVTLAATPKAPLSAEVMETLAPGAYKVRWSTSSDDGHAVSDSFSFKVKK